MPALADTLVNVPDLNITDWKKFVHFKEDVAWYNDGSNPIRVRFNPISANCLDW